MDGLLVGRASPPHIVPYGHYILYICIQIGVILSKF